MDDYYEVFPGLNFLKYCWYFLIFCCSGCKPSVEQVGFAEPVSSLFPWEIRKYQFRDSHQFLGWAPEDSAVLYRNGRRIYKLTRPGERPILQHQLKRDPAYLALGRGNASANLFYTLDQNGDERYRLYDLDGPITRRAHRTTSPVVSPKGNYLVYKSNRLQSDRIDLFLQSLSSRKEAQLILSNITDRGEILDWSDDESSLLIQKSISNNHSELMSFHLPSGRLQTVGFSDQVDYSSARFVPKGDQVIYAAAATGEWKNLFSLDRYSEEILELTPGLEEEVTEIDISPDGSTLAFVTLREARHLLYLMDMKSHSYQRIEKVPTGLLRGLRFDSSGQQIGFSVRTPLSPEEVYSYTLETQELIRWTTSSPLDREARRRTTPDHFYFPSSDSHNDDSLQTPGLVYWPRIQQKSHPVLIDLHGGPAEQAYIHYNPWHQYLVNDLHIVLVRPNFTGSSGYGKTFMASDDLQQREVAVKDIGALLSWIAAHPMLDGERILVSGASYGGYLALAAAIQYPERVKGVITGFGVADWTHFLEHTSDYRRELRRMEFGDERIPEVRAYLEKISPINDLEKIQCPILLMAGYNDPRVPFSGSEALANGLRQHDKPFQAIFFRNEGHGVRKPSNVAIKLNAEIDFIKKNLFF